MTAKWRAPDLSDEDRRALWEEQAERKMQDLGRDGRRLMRLIRELDAHCNDKPGALVRSGRFVETVEDIEKFVELARKLDAPEATS